MADETSAVQRAGALYEQGSLSGALARQLRRGEIVRVRHGAYALRLDQEMELRHRQLIAATMPLVGPEAVLSHDSAAILHGLPLWADSLHRVHITHRCRRSGGHRARQLHQHPGPLIDSEIVLLDGWPTTSLARTVADLARTVALDRAVAFADAGLRLGLPRRHLDQEVEQAGGRHGIGQLRFVAGFADGRAESPGESFSRLLIHRVGLPPPEPQYQVIDPVTGLVLARCDFGWEEHRTVGEFDGRTKYGRLLKPGQEPGEVVFGEKAREDSIRDLGREVVRWIHPDLQRPRGIRDRILRAFARGDRR